MKVDIISFMQLHQDKAIHDIITGNYH